MPHKSLEARRAWARQNRARKIEAFRAYARAHYAKHKERLRPIYAAQKRELYHAVLKNDPLAQEKNRATVAAWRRANPERAVGRYRIQNCTPKWANQFFISEIYHLAKLRSKVLGVPHEVDHIVPLCGKNVCGLHVEHNLRVVPRHINRSKGNRIGSEL